MHLVVNGTSRARFFRALDGDFELKPGEAKAALMRLPSPERLAMWRSAGVRIAPVDPAHVRVGHSLPDLIAHVFDGAPLPDTPAAPAQPAQDGGDGAQGGEGSGDASSAADGAPTGSDPASLVAKHRGRGSYSVMDGEREVVQGLDKGLADAFNALDAEGKAAFVAERIPSGS